MGNANRIICLLSLPVVKSLAKSNVYLGKITINLAAEYYCIEKDKLFRMALYKRH